MADIFIHFVYYVHLNKPCFDYDYLLDLFIHLFYFYFYFFSKKANKVLK